MSASKYVGRLAGAAGVLAVALATWTLGPGAKPATLGAAPDRHTLALNAFANLPLAFVENHGQADSRVRFYAQGPRYAFHFTREAALFTFTEEANPRRGVVLGLRFVLYYIQNSIEHGFLIAFNKPFKSCFAFLRQLLN